MSNPTEAVALIAEFGRWQQRRNLSPVTIKGYRQTMFNFARSLGDTSLTEATAADVEAYLATRRIAARGRYHYISMISAFYQWALDEGHVAEDPTRRVPRPKLPVNRPRPIASADLAVALTTTDTRLRAWLLLGAYQGLRCQEIAGMRREDVLDDENPPMLIVSKPKGNRERVIPLHPDVLAALRVYGLPASGHIFRSRQSSKPVRPYTVSYELTRLFRGFGISATPHQLRHWFGTKLYARTRDLRLTQEMLGHASPTMTAVYVAFAPGDAVDAVTGLAVTPDAAERPRPRLVAPPGGKGTDGELADLLPAHLHHEATSAADELAALLPAIARAATLAEDVVERTEAALPDDTWELDSDVWDRLQAAHPIGALRELLWLAEGLFARAVRDRPAWEAFDELLDRHAETLGLKAG